MVLVTQDRQLDLATKLGNGTYTASGLVTLNGQPSVVNIGNARTQFDLIVDVTGFTGGTGDYHTLYVWGNNPVAPATIWTLGSMSFVGLVGLSNFGRQLGRHILRLDNLGWNEPVDINNFTAGPLPQIQAYIDVAVGRQITFDIWIAKSHQQV